LQTRCTTGVDKPSRVQDMYPFHRILFRHYRAVLVLALALSLGAIFGLARLKLNTDLFSLLPSNHPGTRSFLEVTEEIGVQSLLVVLVEIPAGADPEKIRNFVDMLAGEYLSLPQVRAVRYKADQKKLSSLLSRLMEHFPVFLRPGDLPRLTRRLSSEGIREQTQKNRALLASPIGFAGKELILHDPLGLRDFWKGDGPLTLPGQGFVSPGGYFRTRDGRIYFLFLEPTGPPQDVDYSRRLMTEIRQAEQRVRNRFEKEGRDLGIPSPLVTYAGGYPIALRDEAATKRDIRNTLLTSLLGIMVLFALAFRSLWSLWYMGLPLALSLLWTLGFAGFAFHSINILSGVFSCVLVGLGVDFAIHILNRFCGASDDSAGVEERLKRTFQESGKGILMGGLTTSAAFFSIGISDFGGFRQLGTLTGTGILFCLLAMLFVLPALLVAFSRKGRGHLPEQVRDFGLDPLFFFMKRHRKSVIATVLLAACLLAIPGTRVRFDDNLRNFRPPDQGLFKLQEHITEWLGGSAAEVLLVTEGPSEAEVLETTSALYRAMKKLRESGKIGGVRSLCRWFPPPDRQRRILEYLHAHPDLFDMKRIRSDFRSALKESGFRWMPAYDVYLDRMEKAFSSREILLPSSLDKTGLRDLLRPFLIKKDNAFKTVTYLMPLKDLWSRSDTRDFEILVRNRLKEAGIPEGRYHFTGAAILASDLKVLILKNLESSLWLAGGVILIVLLLYYRRPQWVFLSVLPLGTGLLLLTGLMALLGMDFNFFNLIVLPMLVGIGIDDGVHLTNTYLQHPAGELPGAFAVTGRAVLLTSLTTLVGFGSISLSHYPGLRSMGYLAVLGIGLCFLTSIFLLAPLLLGGAAGRKGTDRGTGRPHS